MRANPPENTIYHFYKSPRLKVLNKYNKFWSEATTDAERHVTRGTDRPSLGLIRANNVRGRSIYAPWSAGPGAHAMQTLQHIIFTKMYPGI